MKTIIAFLIISISIGFIMCCILDVINNRSIEWSVNILIPLVVNITLVGLIKIVYEL